MREAVDAVATVGNKSLTSQFLMDVWLNIALSLATEKFSVEWNAATSAEKLVLRATAEGVPISSAAGKSGTALAIRLIKKGLLLRQGRGEYGPYHPLFAAYIKGESN